MNILAKAFCWAFDKTINLAVKLRRKLYGEAAIEAALEEQFRLHRQVLDYADKLIREENIDKLKEIFLVNGEFRIVEGRSDEELQEIVNKYIKE